MMRTHDNHSRPLVLVTGASGRQGGAVARALLAAGQPVRAMSRKPSPAIDDLVALGATTVIADLEDPASLDAALRDVGAVFAVQTFAGPDGVAGEERQARNLVEAAVRAGGPHVVYSSVGAADAAETVPHFASKARIENLLQATGLPLTVIRPAFFMDNFHEFAVSVADDATVEVALPIHADRPLQMVATDDIGTVAAAAFSAPASFRGQVIELAGDELTGPQIAAAIGSHLDRPARYTALPLAGLAAHSPEMAAMFTFLDEHGYQADLAQLRSQFPGLSSFTAWLRAKDFQLAGAPR